MDGRTRHVLAVGGGALTLNIMRHPVTMRLMLIFCKTGKHFDLIYGSDEAVNFF